MLLTFGELKTSRVLQIASAPPDSPEFASLVNAAIRQLLTRGNWWSTVQPMEGCVTDHCVVWPRYVATVLAVNAGNRHTELANRWYRFLPWDSSNIGWACDYFQHGRGGNITAEMDGTIPVFNPIACNAGMYLQFFIDNATDVGSTITIFGIDSKGQVIRTQRSDGTWQEGIELTLTMPYVQTPMLIRKVARVVKDLTNGMVRGYQWDGVSLSGTSPLLLDLCSYSPAETSPQYLHSRLHGFRSHNACCAFTRITALVKLGYVPVVNDDDLVLIENEDAIRDMVKAIKQKEAGDFPGATASEADAFRELNYQMRDRFPIEQFTANFRPFGDAPLSRVTAGFM
jgi:hypothetical protein